MSIQTSSMTKNYQKSMSSNAHMKSISPEKNTVEEILDKSSGNHTSEKLRGQDQMALF